LDRRAALTDPHSTLRPKVDGHCARTDCVADRLQRDWAREWLTPAAACDSDRRVRKFATTLAVETNRSRMPLANAVARTPR
jgi:hypothetical protein